MQRVAVLGLGTMGIGMALNLLKSFKVVGYNRSAERGRRLEEGGGRFLAEPAEAVRGADAVVACLANDAANRDVLLAPELLDAL
ncbi:MAG: NAD(P)-binding domain-containing protein, partial [Myxococcota bacterium]